jgi:HSP90 family molecular chaperone
LPSLTESSINEQKSDSKWLSEDFNLPSAQKPQLEIPKESMEFLADKSCEEGKEAKMPYLYVDVNITDTDMSTIEVFDGDKAEDLARNFAEKHDLDQKTENKLIEMLKAQMATVLVKIVEEVEESETNEDDESFS